MVLVTAFCFVILAGPGIIHHGDTLARQDPLNGKWQAVAIVRCGRGTSEGIGAVWEFQADNNSYIVHFPGGRTMKGRYQFDAATNPWAVDLENEQSQDGGSRQGIVSIKGDYLRLCVSGSTHDNRPATFVSNGETRSTLRVMKRLDPRAQNDLDFEEVLGWSRAQRQRGVLVQVDNEPSEQGRKCLHMRVDRSQLAAGARGQLAAWWRSQPIPTPQSGTITVLAWMRTRDERQQPQLRAVIDGRVQGIPYYRYVPVGVRARALPDEWSDGPLVIQFGDLPKRGLTDVRIGFDLIGQGEVWIDGVEVISVLGQNPR